MLFSCRFLIKLEKISNIEYNIDTNMKEGVFMSEREQAKQIIDQLPEYKITKILYLLKGIQIDDEIEDDLFCENLAERYINDSDHEVISFEEAIKEAGLTIDDLQDQY